MLNRSPLRVGVLTSHRAPGLRAVFADVRYGQLFEIAGVVSSEETVADALSIVDRGVPLVHRPLRAFHRMHGRPLSDRAVRAAYDTQLVPLLASWQVDLVLCCGYLYVLTDPVLDQWPGHILNVHHSDMLDRTDDGAVRYPGLRAVRDAVFAGAAETRSSVHVVTRELDEGPVLVRSGPFPIAPMVRELRQNGQTAALKAYAFAHQEWMLERSWGPLMVRALELAARRQVRAVVQRECA